MNKERLIAYYNLHNEIRRVERSIFNTEFYEGNGFVWFEKLRIMFYELYCLDDVDKEYTLLDWFENIIDDGMQTFDFGLLTDDEIKSLTDKQGNISILKSQEINYPHALVKFNSIDEVAEYVLK